MKKIAEKFIILISSLFILKYLRIRVREKLFCIFLYNEAEKFGYYNDKAKKKLKRSGLSEFVLNLIKEDSICIDCGANIGKFTTQWANKGGIVHSFEPHSGCFKLLQDKFHNNPNVHLYPSAVGCSNGKVKLYLMEDSSDEDTSIKTESSSLFSEKTNVSRNNYINVDMINICEFIEKFNRKITILKLDVEGSEISIINEVIDLGLHKKIDFIVAEIHKNIPSIHEEIIALKNKINSHFVDNISLDWE